jgi:hypothetical protein
MVIIPIVRKKADEKLTVFTIMRAEDGTTHLRPHRRSGALCGYELGKKHKAIKKLEHVSCKVCKKAMRLAMEMLDNPTALEEALHTIYRVRPSSWSNREIDQDEVAQVNLVCAE